MTAFLTFWKATSLKTKLYIAGTLVVVILAILLSMRSCASRIINTPEVPKNDRKDIPFNNTTDYNSIINQLQKYSSISNGQSSK